MCLQACSGGGRAGRKSEEKRLIEREERKAFNKEFVGK